MWLWNQKYVVEKTYSLKEVEPELVCEKFFQSSGLHNGVSPALAGRFSTTAPPGKPSPFFLMKISQNRIPVFVGPKGVGVPQRVNMSVCEVAKIYMQLSIINTPIYINHARGKKN